MEKEKPIQARRRRVSASPSKLLSVAVEPSKRRRRSFEASPSNRRSVAVKASKRRRRSVSASPSTRLNVAVEAPQRRCRSSPSKLHLVLNRRRRRRFEPSPNQRRRFALFSLATLWTVADELLPISHEPSPILDDSHSLPIHWFGPFVTIWNR